MNRRTVRALTLLAALAAVGAGATGAVLGSWPWIITGALLAAAAATADLADRRTEDRHDGPQVPLDGAGHDRDGWLPEQYRNDDHGGI